MTPQTPATFRLAENLKAAREKRGLNTKDFVKVAGIPGTVLQRLLTEKVDPRLSTIEALAVNLGTTPSKLLS